MAIAVMRDATSLRPEQYDSTPVDDEPETTPRTSVHSVPSPGPVTSGPSLASLAFMAPLAPAGHLGTREDIQTELDGIAMAARTFGLKQPDQVMREVAAYSARLTELAVLLHRVEAADRQYVRIRTQQVDLWLKELDRQFKIASRLVEVNRQDISLLGGQP